MFLFIIFFIGGTKVKVGDRGVMSASFKVCWLPANLKPNHFEMFHW